MGPRYSPELRDPDDFSVALLTLGDGLRGPDSGPPHVELDGRLISGAHSARRTDSKRSPLQGGLSHVFVQKRDRMTGDGRRASANVTQRALRVLDVPPDRNLRGVAPMHVIETVWARRWEEAKSDEAGRGIEMRQVPQACPMSCL